VEGISREGEEQDHEGEQGEDGVGGDGEGVGVDLGLREVADEGDELLAEGGVGRQLWRGLGGGGDADFGVQLGVQLEFCENRQCGSCWWCGRVRRCVRRC
jgi:hypothetical protein